MFLEGEVLNFGHSIFAFVSEFVLRYSDFSPRELFEGTSLAMFSKKCGKRSVVRGVEDGGKDGLHP